MLSNDQLQEILTVSNRLSSVNLQRQIAQEKFDADLTLGYSTGLFKIDINLLMYVKHMLDSGKTSSVIILDSNQTPILIEDLKIFFETIQDRYHTALSKYYAECQDLDVTYRSLKTSMNTVYERIKNE